MIFKKNLSHVFTTLQIVFSVFICANAATKKKADFLIIENPLVYPVLNEYEQQISESEKKYLLPFAPFQIISSGQLLGDQITNAAQFTYNGKPFYIPVNDKFKRIQKSVTWEKIYKNCTIYDDTVSISRAIKIFVKLPDIGTSFTIAKGTKIKRIFLYSSLWYILPVGNNEKYGWYNGSAEVFSINKKHNNTVEQVSTAGITDKIQARIESANEQYKSLFNYFNQITHKQKSIPYWTVVEDGLMIRCILNGSSTTPQHLEKSTRYITGDIEHILLGKPFSARYNDGEIIISPRTQE